MSDIIELPQFNGVASGARVTLAMDQLDGYSVHAFILKLGGTTFTKAHLDLVALSTHSKDLIPSMTGAQLQKLNSYEGLEDDAEYLVLWQGNPNAMTAFGQHMNDLDLSVYDANKTILEVKIAQAAVAPELTAFALIGPSKMSMPYGYSAIDAASVRALVRSVATPTAAVNRKTFGIGLGSEAGAKIRSIGMFHSNVTAVEYKKNGLVKHDEIDSPLNDFVQKEYGKVPQAGLYVLDFVADGNQGKAESTVDGSGKPYPMQVNLTTSGGDTIETYADVRALVRML